MKSETMNDSHDKLTPLQALRAYCIQCLCLPRWNREAIDDCQGDQAACGPCPFFLYRMGRRIPVKVFRRFCLDCTGGDRVYIQDCPAGNCPCYPYRFGKNPALIGKRKSSGAGMEALKKICQKRRDDMKNDQIATISP